MVEGPSPGQRPARWGRRGAGGIVGTGRLRRLLRLGRTGPRLPGTRLHVARDAAPGAGSGSPGGDEHRRGLHDGEAPGRARGHETRGRRRRRVPGPGPPPSGHRARPQAAARFQAFLELWAETRG